MEERQPPSERVSIDELAIFDLMAESGLTKHLGGQKATDELVELCRIGEGKYVLDVGCGVGVTPCYLAKQHGCDVVGLDVSQKMIERSRERARKEGVEDSAQFRVADARALPFKDARFDVVVVESVTAFVQEKGRALSECARVMKAGGFVGLNEATWLKLPSPEMVEYLAGLYIEALAPDGWVELLKGVGLQEVVFRAHNVSAIGESVNRARRYGLAALFGVSLRTIALYFRRPAYRTILRESGSVPKGVFAHMGYGVYVGRK